MRTDIVKELMFGTIVKQRKFVGFKANLLSENDHENGACYEATQKRMLLKKRYELGAKCFGTYFTRREAECMVWLLKGATINIVAAKLNLSTRTVEYYMKNMRNKTRCHTKYELIRLVYSSEFINNLGFAY